MTLVHTSQIIYQEYYMTCGATEHGQMNPEYTLKNKTDLLREDT